VWNESEKRRTSYGSGGGGGAIHGGTTEDGDGEGEIGRGDEDRRGGA